MNEQQMRAIAAIRRHMCKRPKSVWPKSHFTQSSYSIWAAYELIDYIQKNPGTPATRLAEELARKMDNYACINPATSLIFSIGKDAIVDLLDVLLSMD